MRPTPSRRRQTCPTSSKKMRPQPNAPKKGGERSPHLLTATPKRLCVANRLAEPLKRAVHSSEQPSEAERDGYCRIRLIFDGVAQCLLKGTGGLGGAVDGLAIEVLGGIRYFTGPFLAVNISARGRGLWHINAPVVVGVNAQERTKEPEFQMRERPPIETGSSHCVDTPNSKPHLMVARRTIVDADMCVGSFRRWVDACCVHIFPAPTHGPFS